MKLSPRPPGVVPPPTPTRRPIALPLMRAFAVASVLLGALLSTGAAAPEPAAAPAPDPPPNRYLLIVETSSAMERRASAVIEHLRRLFASGLKGDFHDGDMIAVWTFNDRLYTGGLAVQYWAPAQKEAITSRVIKYLTSLPLEKSPRFSTVTAGLEHVLKISDYLTVVLFCTGTEDVSGTPFDEQINATFKQWRAQQQKNNQPYIVILRATKGTFTNARVTAAPWPVEIPPFPPELKLAREEAGRAAAALAKAKADSASTATPVTPPVRMGQPLIVIGKKPKPEETPAPSPEQPVVPPPLPASTHDPAPPTPNTQSAAAPGPLPIASEPPTQNPAILQPKPTTQTEPVLQPPSPTPASIQPSPLPVAGLPPAPPPSAPTTSPVADPAPLQSAVEPPGQVAAATPVPVTARSPFLLLVASGFVLAVAAVAAFLFLRRSRRQQPVSLITQSLDRTHKP